MISGQRIGGYQLLEPLGSGGMGTVWRALDGGETQVALKLLHPQIAAHEAARTRLLREAASLNRLRHPGVAQVLDVEADSDHAFVVLELLEGPSLASEIGAGWLSRQATGASGPGLERLITVGASLAATLRAVHAAGVIHRDVKPSNILLTDRGPVLIDFGLAQSSDDERFTSTGLVTGTPGYLAPEYLEGAPLDPGADWWALAASLLHAATGRPPFGAGGWQVVLTRVARGQADLAGLPTAVADAFSGALAVDPAQRPEPEELLAALRQASFSFEPDAAPTATVSPTAALPTATVSPTAALPTAVGKVPAPPVELTAVMNTFPAQLPPTVALAADYALPAYNEPILPAPVQLHTRVGWTGGMLILFAFIWLLNWKAAGLLGLLFALAMSTVGCASKSRFAAARRRAAGKAPRPVAATLALPWHLGKGLIYAAVVSVLGYLAGTIVWIVANGDLAFVQQPGPQLHFTQLFSAQVWPPISLTALFWLLSGLAVVCTAISSPPAAPLRAGWIATLGALRSPALRLGAFALFAAIAAAIVFL